jgi:nucleotide-binding universal stress UspA family protein
MIRILVAVDGSHASMHALKRFLALRAQFAEEPELHAVAVVDYADLPEQLAKTPSQAPDLLASEAETALAVAEEQARAAGTSISVHLRRGHTVEQILMQAAEISADIIVIGTHGRKGLQRAMLGSTCDGVIRHAEVPVLAIRH